MGGGAAPAAVAVAEPEPSSSSVVGREEGVSDDEYLQRLQERAAKLIEDADAREAATDGAKDDA